MTGSNLLHKSFLIFMFILCSFAVVLFVKQRANASDVNSVYIPDTSGSSALLGAGTTSTAGAVRTPINGTCSAINGTTVEAEPASTYVCATGTVANFVSTDVGWSWACVGIYNGTTSRCTATKYVNLTDTTVNTAETSVAASTTSNTNDTLNAPTTTAQLTTSPVNTNNNGNTAAVISNMDTAGTIKNDSIETSTTATKTEDSTSKSVPVSTKTAYTTTPDTVKSEVAVQADQPPVFTDQNSTQKTMSLSASQIITASVVIEGKNLALSNNPKATGALSDSLKVENVVLNKKEGGENRVAFSGKALPNTSVTIYIFSNDPVVITVKTDADGNWNYELDKELADGQHEVYVAVTDNAGKIVTKSQPIAFVKTAQAASMIPMSEFTSTQSPIQKSASQYVLMAIIIMSVCLAVALILMGYLNHKQNLDEEIDQ